MSRRVQKCESSHRILIKKRSFGPNFLELGSEGLTDNISFSFFFSFVFYLIKALLNLDESIKKKRINRIK